MDRTPVKGIIFAWLCMGVMLLGCSAAREENRASSFRSSVKAYNEKMRWQQYGDASKFVPKKQRNAFLEYYEYKRDTLHIEDVRVISNEVDEDDPLKANAKVLITFFELPNPTVKKEFQDQSWIYQEDLEKWLIELSFLPKEEPKKSTAPKKESHRPQ